MLSVAEMVEPMGLSSIFITEKSMLRSEKMHEKKREEERLEKVRRKKKRKEENIPI